MVCNLSFWCRYNNFSYFCCCDMILKRLRWYVHVFWLALNRMEIVETKWWKLENSEVSCSKRLSKDGHFFLFSYQDTILLVRYEVVLNGGCDWRIHWCCYNKFFLFQKISILEYQIYPYPIYGFKGADFWPLPQTSIRPNLECTCTGYAILIPL